MRQRHLGEMLESLMTETARTRCRVESQATGDSNAPGFSSALARIDLAIHELSPRDRIQRSEDYQESVTHEAFGADNATLVDGDHLVETHRLTDRGQWTPVAATSAQTWKIVRKSYVPGIPQPHDQVQLDLHRVTPR